ADAVTLQEEHDGTDGFLFTPARPDLLKALRPDAPDLAQEGRAFVDDGQGAFAEDRDDLVGEVRPDALDQAGAEVLFDAFLRVRGDGVDFVGLELQPVFG